MPAVIDVLETRLELTGLTQYQAGLRGAEAGINRLHLASAALGTGAAAGLLFFGKAAMAAGDEAATFQTAAGNFKGAFPVDELKQFAGGLQDLTGVADDQIAGFVGLLGTYRTTQHQARALALPILNASRALAAQGVTAESLATQIGKAFESGNLTGLRRFGIFVDESRFKADRFGAVIDALQRQGGDAAIEFRKTLPGALQALQSAFSDLQEAIGEPLIDPLIRVINAASDAAKVFNNLPGPIKAVASVIGVAFVVAMAGASTAIQAAIWWQNRYLVKLGEVAKAQELVGNGAATMGGKQAAGGATAAGGRGAGGAASGGWKGKIGGAASALTVAYLAWEAVSAVQAQWAAGKSVTDPGGSHGKFGDAARKYLPGVVPTSKAADPMVTEQQKTNQLLAAQNDKLDRMGGDQFAPSSFMPIGIQRAAVRRFARDTR